MTHIQIGLRQAKPIVADSLDRIGMMFLSQVSDME